MTKKRYQEITGLLKALAKRENIEDGVAFSVYFEPDSRQPEVLEGAVLEVGYEGEEDEDGDYALGL